MELRRFAALAATTAIVLGACSSGSTPAPAGSAAAASGGTGAANYNTGIDGKGCTVGVSWNNFQQPRWAAHDKPNIQKTVEAAGGTVVDVLDRRLMPQPGVAQPRAEPAVVAICGLAIEEQRQPLGMGEPGGARIGFQLGEGPGHPRQPELLKLVEGRVGQHEGDLLNGSSVGRGCWDGRARSAPCRLGRRGCRSRPFLRIDWIEP